MLPSNGSGATVNNFENILATVSARTMIFGIIRGLCARLKSAVNKHKYNLDVRQIFQKCRKCKINLRLDYIHTNFQLRFSKLLSMMLSKAKKVFKVEKQTKNYEYLSEPPEKFHFTWNSIFSDC